MTVFLGCACTRPLIRGVDTYPEGVPEEKRSRSQTRARILDAAFALFVQQGFQGTTLSEVERRVGLKVGTGSLYHHFRTKDELLRAAIEAEVGRCMAEVENERASITWPEDPRDQMVLVAKLTLSNVRRVRAGLPLPPDRRRSNPRPTRKSNRSAVRIRSPRGLGPRPDKAGDDRRASRIPPVSTGGRLLRCALFPRRSSSKSSSR